MEMSGEYPLYATLYYYDLRNRLSHVSKSGSIADFISYTLDSRGRRTNLYQYYGAYPTKDINMSYSGGTSVYERDYVMNALELVRDTTQIFYRGNDLGGGVGGLLYASNLDGTDLNYKHYNLRGDVVQTTDNSGVIESNLYYTAFGAMTTTGTSPADSFRNNTKYRDSYGIINEGFRCRPTDSDRFLTPDPLEYIDGLNPYIYCSQNPWGRFDPLGLAEQELRETPVDDNVAGGFLKEMHTSRVVKFTGEEYKRVQKETGISDKLRTRLGSKIQDDGSASVVISFFEVGGNLKVEYNDKDDSPRKTSHVTKIEPKDKENDKYGYIAALNVLKACSIYEKNEDNVIYSTYFSGENKGNCNAAQTALNAASGSVYSKNLSATQWGVDLSYSTTRFSIAGQILTQLGYANSRHNINKTDLQKQFEDKKDTK